ncbi:MAG: beta-propeller domain-containing protein [Pirellulales bacterium]
MVAVAEIAAQYDYFSLGPETEQIQFEVLANDLLPIGAESLHIKAISEPFFGASATISDDGQRIIYSPTDKNSFDSFSYTVEDNLGNRGKANVNVRLAMSSPIEIRDLGRDTFEIIEDGPLRKLDVLRNDGDFDNGTIVELRKSVGLGTSLHIADDGKSLLYQPIAGTGGCEIYEYTVRNEMSETETFQIIANLVKPVEPWGDYFTFDSGLGPQLLDVLGNDFVRHNSLEVPRITEVSEVPGGTLTIADDEQHLIFTPNEEFLGRVTFDYSVRYGPDAYHIAYGGGVIHVRNAFLAVDNFFSINPGSSNNRLDVLANDLLPEHGDSSIAAQYVTPSTYGEGVLTIVAVSSGSQGGQLSIENGKRIRYTPRAGFTGEETFDYTVADINGFQDTATVTLNVVSREVDATSMPKFILAHEVEQLLIDKAAQLYAQSFGVSQVDTRVLPPTRFSRSVALSSVLPRIEFPDLLSETFSLGTHLNEGDTLVADSRHVFTFSHGSLIVFDMSDPANPLVASRTELPDRYSELYLQGDRITLIDRGGYEQVPAFRDGLFSLDSRVTSAVVTVLDIADRAIPKMVERTEIDGSIIDTHAAGDQIYLAVSNWTQIPALKMSEPTSSDSNAILGTFETLDQYIARVRGTMTRRSLPKYRTFGADGSLISAGLLTHPTMIHKPADNGDALLSLTTFNVGNGQAGPSGSAGIFTRHETKVHMTDDSLYVMQSSNHATTVHKFSISYDGAPSLVATGTIDGNLLNKKFVDVHNGLFRIVTTQSIYGAHVEDRGLRHNNLKSQQFNSLFVLEQRGAALDIIGSLRRMAPAESIRSVSFMDDVAYVITASKAAPLFVIDLSDTTNPMVTGSLNTRGYLSSVQVVDKEHLIGIGGAVDEMTGDRFGLQISLFSVGDLANPTLADQVTMEGSMWANAPAGWDQHAMSYLADGQLLTIPVNWSELGDGPSGAFKNHPPVHKSAMWAFQIDADQQEGGNIHTIGNVEHDGRAQMSILFGTSLITISEDYLKINSLHAIAELLAVIKLANPDEPIAISGRDETSLTIPTACHSLYGYLLAGWNGGSGGAFTPAGSVEVADDHDSLAILQVLPIVDEGLVLSTGAQQENNSGDFREVTRQNAPEEAAVDCVLQRWNEIDSFCVLPREILSFY